ncbi:hypothetical protein ABTZ03_43515 [Kitasatospora sp. NPDC096077]|uniref:hypothetical protein n=1 Tax=Kitasatospora sp. NPDC096077 TaxID=3155544 RepID=UPI003319797D
MALRAGCGSVTVQGVVQQKIATFTDTRSSTCNNAGRAGADVTEPAKTWASAKATTGSRSSSAAAWECSAESAS